MNRWTIYSRYLPEHQVNIFVFAAVFLFTLSVLPKKMDKNSPGFGWSFPTHLPTPFPTFRTFPTQLPNKVRISVQDQSTDLSLGWCGWFCFFLRRWKATGRNPIAVGRSKQRVSSVWLGYLGYSVRMRVREIQVLYKKQKNGRKNLRQGYQKETEQL